jgi:SH3-like domain-containing protein
MLPAGLELVFESQAGAWAQVRAVNGWRGWVDGRVLVARR